MSCFCKLKKGIPPHITIKVKRPNLGIEMTSSVRIGSFIRFPNTDLLARTSAKFGNQNRGQQISLRSNGKK
jgi:hypothetical protein